MLWHEIEATDSKIVEKGGPKRVPAPRPPTGAFGEAFFLSGFLNVPIPHAPGVRRDEVLA